MKISLNVQLALSLLLGLIFSITYAWLGIHSAWLEQSLESIGANFIHALQLIAVPLVFCSIILAVSGINNKAQLSRMGGLTIILYLLTTIFAVSLGLLIGNSAQPGVLFKEIGGIRSFNRSEAEKIVPTVTPATSSQRFIPNNFFQLFADNNNLTAIVLFSILFGLALLTIPPKRKKTLLGFFESIQEVLVRIMKYIMCVAPIGTFCLIVPQFIKLIHQSSSSVPSVLLGIGYYAFTVIIGLSIMLFILYPLAVKLFTKVSYSQFLKTMQPAQMVAFTTASSTGTLYKTSEQVGRLNVPERIRNFVLSLGATINMDGTALYQGVAVLFITQAFGYSLNFNEQLYIIYYVTVSTIGVAGMPGASLVTSTILLNKLNENIGLTSGQMTMALALICLPDRLLDMFRTTTNVTGDAAVTLIVNESEHSWQKKQASKANAV